MDKKMCMLVHHLSGDNGEVRLYRRKGVNITSRTFPYQAVVFHYTGVRYKTRWCKTPAKAMTEAGRFF